MSNVSVSREPLVRIVKKEGTPFWKGMLIRLCALVIALILCALIIVAIINVNPLKVYGTMWEGAFGTSKRMWFTLRDTATLLCIAVGLAPAFAMKFWNVGAEGQVLMGGIATVACMKYFGALPTPLLLLVMIIASVIAGGIWGFFPGFFKARWNTNETLFTLMMNYIALQLTSFFVAKWETPAGSNKVGIINPNDSIGWLPNLFSDGYNKDFGWNVLIVLVITIAMYLYMNKSKQGYEIAVIGDSVNTARYAGIRVNKAYVRTIVISGAICGLAGFIAVSGSSHTISTSTAGGRGFTAIIVAWLAQFNSVVMVIFSFLLIILEKGSQAIASQYGISHEMSDMITGIILFFLLGSEFFVNYTVRFRGKKVSK